jgi:hypothetical protein
MRISEIESKHRVHRSSTVPTAMKRSARIRRLAAWFDQQEANQPATGEEIARALIYQSDLQRITDKNYVRNLKQQLANATNS